MQELQLFNFGNAEIRTVIVDNGEPLFVAKDIADALGYSDPMKAVNLHCEGGALRFAPFNTSGGIQELRVISESDVYDLIFSSRLESAKEFRRWITQSVLPTIRKTGKYDIETDTWLKERNEFLESQNKRIIESTTNAVMKCRDKSRRLASNAIVADCDANMYRNIYLKSVKYKEVLAKAKNKLSRNKTDDHVLFGDLNHITEQLKRRLDYEDLCEQVELRELIMKANIKNKVRPQYEPVEEVDKLVESLISINAIPSLSA